MTDPISTALAAIRRGLVVGVPTDTVYGLAVDLSREDAVSSLISLKGRSPQNPVAVLVASLDQAQSLGDFGPKAKELATRYWPGPLTLVVARHRGLPGWIGDVTTASVGVRAPDHARLLELLEIAGPLAVSSANRSGQPPATSAAQARAIFGEGVAFYVEGPCPGGSSSTVLDVTVEPARLVRAGPVPWPEEPLP